MQSFLCLSCLVLLLQGSYTKFVVERRKDGSDRFIEIDGKKTEKDESTFRSDGTCFDTKKYIASAIGDSRIRCYTGTGMKYIGNEVCDLGPVIVERTDKTYPFSYLKCGVERIDSIMMWSPDGWKNFNYQEDTFLRSELIFQQNGDLMFKERANWDGILLRIFIYCRTTGVECITLKFTGNRTYPVADNLSEVLFTTTTTTTTTPTTTTTLPPTTTTTTMTSTPTTRRQKPTTDDNATTKQVIVVEQQRDDDEEGGINTGLVIGMIMLVLILVAISLALFLYMKRRRSADKRKKMDPSIYATGDNVYEVNDESEKSVMITSASYATPAHPQPQYRELEPEYAKPSSSSTPAKTPEQPYGVPEKNADLVPRSGESPDKFYYDTPANQDGKKTNDLYAKVKK